MANLSDLKKEALGCGLDVRQSGKRPAKEDYLQALRVHYLRRDFPNGLPYSEVTPMLCVDYWGLHPKEQDALWNDMNWVAQEKLNGVRLILHFVKGVGVFAHSRTISVHTYRRTELTERLLFGSYVPDFTGTVDAECVCRGGDLQKTNALLHMESEASTKFQKEQNCPLVAHVFDILSWQGTDLRGKKLCERLSYLPDFRVAVTTADLGDYFAFPEIHLHGKKEVYDKILADGGEGVVLKNLNFTYVDSLRRCRVGWVKCKRQLVMDAYISGIERGRAGSDYENKIACLIFSVETEEGPLPIAKVSSLAWDYRKRVSLYDKGSNTVKLDVGQYGRVARLSGLELSMRARRLVHPRIVHWMNHLSQEQCVYSFKDIEMVRKGMIGISLARIVSGSVS